MKYSIVKEDKAYVTVKASTESPDDKRVLAMFQDGETSLENSELQNLLNNVGKVVRDKDYEVTHVDVPNGDIFAVKIKPKYV